MTEWSIPLYIECISVHLVVYVCDYEDFLRQNRFLLWKLDDPRCKELIKKRFQTADELARWVGSQHKQSRIPIPEIAANAILTVLSITCMLLKRQIDAQARAFQKRADLLNVSTTCENNPKN